MKKKSISLRTSVVALASTVALAALMTAGATTAFADTEHSDAVEKNLTSSSVTAAGPYSIYDAADMVALDTYVEGGGVTNGITFNLQADVTLSSGWNGIGSVTSQDNSYGTSSVSSSSTSFEGVFHGNGKTITLSDGKQGVFAFLGINASVDNFTVAQADSNSYGVETDSSSDYFAAVAGFSRGKIAEVTNNASVYAPNAYNVGGIVGFNDGYNVGGQTYVAGCVNNAAVTGKQKVGGIAGENAASIILCENDGKIVGTNTSSKNGVGGIAGRNGNNNTARETGVIASCLNKGEVGSASQKWVGGITGFQNSKSSISGSLSTGNIVAGAGYYNPVVGKNESSLDGTNFRSSSSTGSSSAINELGTQWDNSASTLNGARNTSVVTANCWSGSDTSVALSLTATFSAPSNAAMGDTAAAINVYLDGSAGNDSNAGTDSSAPVKTLERAAAVVSAGGDGSKIFVSNTATVSSDVAIRQDITISWTGDSNGTMFTVSGGTLTLGGSVKVVAGTGASATAFDLTGGNLVVQDNASITAGKYAAKVASGKTMSINNSTIGGTVYLYSGGLLNLPSELSSSISVECASLSTSNTAIANCGNSAIASNNVTHINVSNSNTTLSATFSKIYCKLASNGIQNETMNAQSLSALESNRETVYEWKMSYTGSPQTKAIPDGWTAMYSTGAQSNWGYQNLDSYNGKTKGIAWMQFFTGGQYNKNRLTDVGYIMPSNKINLGANSTLTFEGLLNMKSVISIYVADDISSIDNFTFVEDVTIGEISMDVDAWQTPVTKTVDLSAYTGEKYVIFAVSGQKNKDQYDFLVEMGETGDYQVCFGNVSITSDAASTDPAMTLTTEAKDLKVGDEVTVNVDMENITAYGQGTFSCSDNLTLKSIEAGSALKFDGDSGFTGTVDNKLFSFFNNTGTEDGTVAKATFTCTKAGDATVSLAGVKAGAALDPSEPEELSVADLKLSVGLNALAGDVNNSGKVNIVDAQVTYDMVKGNYADGSEARTNLLKCWTPETTGATYDLIVNVANVNGEELTASDAFAIQYFVHYGKFGATTEA